MKTAGFLMNLFTGAVLLITVLSGSGIFLAGCYTDKKISTTTVEMVVVFKKDVPVAKSSSILFEKEYIFHEGSDSSRGKKYFYETGPRYIVQVPKEKMEAFYTEMKGIPQIHEIYKADWSVHKD